MKQFLLMVFSILILVSCEDSFTQTGNYKEDYAMGAILQGDTSVQTITLSKNYILEDLSQPRNPKNLWVKNATVTLSFDEEAYIFNQVEDDIVKYEVGNLKLPIDKTIKIEALLPDGRWIRAFTKTPKEVSFSGYSNKYLPSEDNSDIYSVSWRSFERDVNFFPKLTLEYNVQENGILKNYKIPVPQEYLIVDDKEVAIYPDASSQIGCAFKMDALNKLMTSIYQKESHSRSDYFINKVLRFELIIMDQNLTSYYLITNNILDTYSVKLDESEYSNIEGGIGIFGSFIKQEYFFYLTDEYIYSFGYRIKTN